MRSIDLPPKNGSTLKVRVTVTTLTGEVHLIGKRGTVEKTKYKSGIKLKD